jgi:hypothetical protein
LILNAGFTHFVTDGFMVTDTRTNHFSSHPQSLGTAADQAHSPARLVRSLEQKNEAAKLRRPLTLYRRAKKPTGKSRFPLVREST